MRGLTEDRTNCVQKYRKVSFDCASRSLRADKDFMCKFLRTTRQVDLASPGLQRDNELVLLAFSNCPRDFVDHYIMTSHYEGQTIFLRELRGTVESKLELHETCMSLNPKSSLSHLNQSVKTSMHYKELIAQFLDVPIGKELHGLRRAMANLSNV